MRRSVRRGMFAGMLCTSMLLLAACGVTSGSASATQTSTAGPATDCGWIGGSGATQGGGGDASTAETCFATAYAHCTPASLVYTQFGVDAGVIHTLRIARGANGCLVTDDAQRYNVVTQRGTSEPTVHFTCSAVESFDGGIRIQQCGAEGDIVIASGA